MQIKKDKRNEIKSTSFKIPLSVSQGIRTGVSQKRSLQTVEKGIGKILLEAVA